MNDWKPPRGTAQNQRDTAPSARWATNKELKANTYATGQILLGEHQGEWIGSNDDRHLLTVAGSRAGKSSTCLKPNLLLWPSSVLCIDPKGELAEATALARAKMGQDVYILDPFGEVKGEAAKYRASFNPLDELRSADPDSVIDDCALLADALIVPDKGGDQHWTLSAKNLVRGLMLYVLLKGGKNGSLVDLREMITAPLGDDKETPDGDQIWLSTYFKLMMAEEDAFDGVLSGVGGTMFGKPKGERGSIISTAVEQTSFLDSTPMRKHLSESDLRPLPSLRVLKQRPTTIYMVLPASRMATHYRWFRMILTLALSALEREPMALPSPVLFVLEEFPQLGYMRQIEAAAGLMAGYGVKLWTVLQDLSQIKSLYRDSWETFIGNAGVVQAFGNTDATTLEYLSRSIGNLQIEEINKVSPSISQFAGGASGEQKTKRTTPLLAPFEIAQYCARNTQKQIILFAGKPPAFINRLTHDQVKGITSL